MLTHFQVMLNQLKSVRGRCTIKVRVIQVWKQSFKNNPKETFSLEMILMDEEGNKVQASVLVKWLIKFQKHLAEFQCLLIKDGGVSQNLAKIKYVDVSQKVSLLPDTSVTRCTDFGGPLYEFAFASFDLLSTNPFEENHSVDIIGLVQSVSGIEDVKLKNSDKICKRFSLIFYDGRPYVSNGFNATRLLINEEIDEISTFKKHFYIRLLDANKGQGSSGYHVTKSISLQDDFLDEERFMHIAELDEVKEVKKVTIFGVIECIPRQMQWYYVAHKKCNKQVSPNYFQTEQDYQCPKCKESVVDVVARYKIHMEVQDSTGTVALTLWERDAIKLFGKTAKDMLDGILDAPEDMDLFPQEFKDLEGKKFAFKIAISQYNLENNNKVYSIEKLTQDSTIIDQLQQNLNIDQISNYEESENPGDHSVTDENGTPIKIGNHESPLISENGKLKRRRLQRVYEDDEDEVICHSATKVHTYLDKSDPKHMRRIRKFYLDSKKGKYIANNNDTTSSSNNRRYYISCNWTSTTNSSSFSTHFSLKRLSSGKHKLKSKMVDIYDIPMIDLTEEVVVCSHLK
ncbi:hypothetical protein SSX86_032715, partial [Deinandra increscens subsp. villosa]